MLKIHKGLKKKKKDKKHKHKTDDLFDEEELERYRKEHQQQLQQQGEQEGSCGHSETFSQVSSSANSDEWKKFKALTAGIDCVLQKTQEDLDRIKSTSFFQRKPVPSELPEVSDRSQQEEGTHLHEQHSTDCLDSENKPDHVDADNFELAHSEELAAKEDADEEEFEEDDIFNTSYVEAVTSGELKLAHIPDSPIEDSKEGYDPFDTSIADKFIVNNPKKRYLNLGCAVQVLSGKADSASVTPTVVASSAAKRRIVRPVQLLLDSFDESTPATTEPVIASAESPIKTLLDEDPTDLGDRTPVCEVLPLPTVVAAISAINETALLAPKTGSQSPVPAPLIESLSLAEFETFSVTPAETDLFKQVSINSYGSIDDEFAELAQARKSSTIVAATTPTTPVVGKPIDSLATSPVIEIHEIGVDPFDTSIADKLISSSKVEEPTQLLDHQSVSVLAAIEDDDFDPRANSFDLTTPLEAPHTTLTPNFSSSSTTASTVDISHATIESPTDSKDDNQNEDDEEIDDYDPFDTSYVVTLNTV